MGCDIHTYIERKEHDKYWLFADIWIPRNYELFRHMAGVRNYRNGHGQVVAPVVEPRGLPDDLSSWVEGEYESGRADFHGESWLTLRELQQVYEKCHNTCLGAIIAAMTLLDAAGCEPRLVFWFDN